MEFDIIQRITDFNGDVETFVRDIKAYASRMKRQSDAYAIIESLEYMHGEYVWVLNPRLVDTRTNKLKLDQLYLEARAKFDSDGTDNRLELTPENQLSQEIQQSHIVAIQYGCPFGTLWHNDAEKYEKWWYRTSNYSQNEWFDSALISSVNKQDLINRWSGQYEELRNNYFANHYMEKEKERQRKIAEAKRILEQWSVTLSSSDT